MLIPRGVPGGYFLIDRSPKYDLKAFPGNSVLLLVAPVKDNICVT